MEGHHKFGKVWLNVSKLQLKRNVILITTIVSEYFPMDR